MTSTALNTIEPCGAIIIPGTPDNTGSCHSMGESEGGEREGGEREGGEREGGERE